MEPLQKWNYTDYVHLLFLWKFFLLPRCIFTPASDKGAILLSISNLLLSKGEADACRTDCCMKIKLPFRSMLYSVNRLFEYNFTILGKTASASYNIYT